MGVRVDLPPVESVSGGMGCVWICDREGWMLQGIQDRVGGGLSALEVHFFPTSGLGVSLHHLTGQELPLEVIS